MSSIAAIASPQAQLGHQIAIKMMSKSQDLAKQQGQAAVSMLQQAAEMQQQLAAQSGKGINLDAIG